MSKNKDILRDAVENIAGIIYYQLPLKAQDKWLADIMDKGIWNPEETTFAGFASINPEDDE